MKINELINENQRLKEKDMKNKERINKLTVNNNFSNINNTFRRNFSVGGKPNFDHNNFIPNENNFMNNNMSGIGSTGSMNINMNNNINLPDDIFITSQQKSLEEFKKVLNMVEEDLQKDKSYVSLNTNN